MVSAPNFVFVGKMIHHSSVKHILTAELKCVIELVQRRPNMSLDFYVINQRCQNLHQTS